MSVSEDDPTISSPKTPPTSSAQDWVLEEAVQIANKIDGFGLAITLTVRGAVVTGILIGAQEYYTKYGAMWRNAIGSDTEEGRKVEEHWVEFGKQTREMYLEKPLDDPSLSPPHYIHLSEARYVMGVSLVPGAPGMLWRGRLSEVSGFSLGTLDRGSRGDR